MSRNKRIKKFNAGYRAVLCNRCSIIVYSGIEGEGEGPITDEEWNSNKPCYCKKCKIMLGIEDDPEAIIESVDNYESGDILYCTKDLKYDDGDISF